MMQNSRLRKVKAVENANEQNDLVISIEELARKQKPAKQKKFPSAERLMRCKSNLDVAKEYAKAGFYVFPANPTQIKTKTEEKKPDIKEPTTDLDQLIKFWSETPDALVGLPTGPKNGLLVLDYTSSRFATIEDISQYLSKFNFSPTSNAPIAQTPNSVQAFFKWPMGASTLSTSLGAQLRIKGSGDFIVAPGTILKKGLRIVWLDERSSDRRNLVMPPNDLIAFLRRTACRKTNHYDLGVLLKDDTCDNPGIGGTSLSMKDPEHLDDQSVIIPVNTAMHTTNRDDYLVENMLFRGELALLVGCPSAGKSFVAADLGVSLATGCNWVGQNVKKSGVLYIALEGIRGIVKRFRAQAETKNMHPEENYPIGYAAVSLDLCSKRGLQTLHELITTFAAKFGLHPDLIIIDTLAQAIDGDENSSKDMGTFLKTCQEVIRNTGVTILLVHHSGKGSNSEIRGHSSLKAACDTIFSLEEKNKKRILREMKQKDSSCSFETEVVLEEFHLTKQHPTTGKVEKTCLPVYQNIQKKGG